MTYNKPEVRCAGSALETVQNTVRSKGTSVFFDSTGGCRPNALPPPAYQADE